MANKDNIIEKTVEAVEETVVERPYTLRKLKDGDLFPLLQLFRKIGLKEFKNAIMQILDSNNSKEIGIVVMLDMADTIIAHIGGEAGNDIYAFWSELSGISVEDMKEMEFGTLPMMIIDSSFSMQYMFLPTSPKPPSAYIETGIVDVLSIISPLCLRF